MHKSLLRSWRLLSLRVGQGPLGVAKETGYFFEQELAAFTASTSGTVVARTFGRRDEREDRIFVNGIQTYSKKCLIVCDNNKMFYEEIKAVDDRYFYTMTSFTEKQGSSTHVYGWRETKDDASKNVPFLEGSGVQGSTLSPVYTDIVIFNAFSKLTHTYATQLESLPEKPLFSWLVGGRRTVANIVGKTAEWLSSGPK